MDEVHKLLSELGSLSEGDGTVFEASKIFTNFTEKDLDEIQYRFNVLDIDLVCPVQFQSADCPPTDYVAIYLQIENGT